MAITGELNLVQQILVRSLKFYKETFAVLQNIRHAVEDAPKEKNATVRFPMVKRAEVNDVVPGPTPTNSGDINTSHMDLKLEHWRDSEFVLTDTQFANLNDKMMDDLIKRAMEALGLDVEATALSLYKKSYAFVGVPGTTPFGSGISEAIAVRKAMNEMNVPRNNRILCLDPIAEAKALELPAFSNANQAGTDKTIREGYIGRKLGFDWDASNHMPTHSTSGSNDWLVAGGSQSGNELMVDTGSTQPVAGDIFTVAGHDQTYVVDAVAGNTWTIEPELKVAPSDNAAITFKASHEVSLAWDRDALGVMFAPFAKPPQDQSWTQMIIDPDSKIPIRLEVLREFKQYRFVFDILYGKAALHRDGMVRLAG